MPTLWCSEVNEAILEQAKVAEQDYDYMLQFLKRLNDVHKISSRNIKLYKFRIKIYLEPFASIFNLYTLFGIIYKSIFYNLNIPLMNNSSISKTINIRGEFL